MSTLKRNLENREWLFERLRAEIIGPDPSGKPFENDVVANNFYTWEQFRGPKHQKNGEEILWQDSPIKRYGAGILFPQGMTDLEQLSRESNDAASGSHEVELDNDNEIDEKLERNAERKAAKTGQGSDDSAEEDVSLANSYRPSAMGLSFFADLSKLDADLHVIPEFGIYKKIDVRVGESSEANQFAKRELWCRSSLQGLEGDGPKISFSKQDLLETKEPLKKWVPGYEGKLQIVVLVRTTKNAISPDHKLLTISIVNRQIKTEKRIDELCFFQSGFSVGSDNECSWILPYPEIIRDNCSPGDEEEIIRLLYREHYTFAIGHGCSADWIKDRPKNIFKVWTECLPHFETPATSADLYDENGQPLRVSMRNLAGLDSGNNGEDEIEALLGAYERWIKALKNMTNHQPPISEDLHGTATILIDKCVLCADRIRKGLEYLRSDGGDAETAREAFKLANHAMLIAQLRSSREVRKPVGGTSRLEYDRPIHNPDLSVPHEYKGYWRAFQIAFLLMSIPGICRPEDKARDVVDLIWFPTGGGKTEAYLGLTAFTIFYNRISERDLGGADVLMRYTLRLLTAQQFQRAALLFCAMEFLRRNPPRCNLGDTPFRLGMWVGGSATPNKRAHAKSALTQLQRDSEAENPFVLLKCPWCNALFGPINNQGGGKRKTRSKSRNVLGYKKYRNPDGGADTVAFRCDDPDCEFGEHPAIPKPPLPIIIIDEDLFDSPPNLIIGTVDKFAMLAWRPEARAIFGIGSDGKHIGLPPSLIIQDELHLISGPLGSMVGIYETLIDELCTLREGEKIQRPKIVASTATISRAEEQVRALYARDQVSIFPPSGLEAGDSFFAREDKNSDGTLKPGRLYAGVMAPGHGSLQTTEARVFATLLQSPAIMPVADNDESERDPWWTLLCFFNSLRELGGAATLLVSDARDYLRVIIDRHGFPYNQIRQLLNVEELTSRIRSDFIPRSIQKLERPFSRNEKGYVNDTVEVCLASNIIEVGIDIDRLSLMAIVGQPKTTSQYIQVSSRVGRNPSSPGLVAVLYSQSKPRDRSHFERFRMYHQRLYAQVEPTSVTPFSPPAVERALHSVLVAIVRQIGDKNVSDSPRPFPLPQGSLLCDYVNRVFERRAAFVDPEELQNVKKMLSKRLDEWRGWNPNEYGSFGSPGEDPTLMYPAGSDVPASWGGRSWPVMSSLRNVDASCEAEITSHYNQMQEEGEI